MNSTRFRSALQPLQSATLAKAQKMMELHDCGTISAERGAYRGPEQGSKRRDYKEHLWYLKNELEDKGYSVTQTRGTWTEGDNPTTAEVSFFVVDYKDHGTLKQDLQEIGQEYAQDAIMFIPKGSNSAEMHVTARPQVYQNNRWSTPAEWSEGKWPSLGDAPAELPGKTFGKSRQATTQFRGRPMGMGSTDNPENPFNNPYAREATYQEKKAARTAARAK